MARLGSIVTVGMMAALAAQRLAVTVALLVPVQGPITVPPFTPTVGGRSGTGITVTGTIIIGAQSSPGLRAGDRGVLPPRHRATVTGSRCGHGASAVPGPGDRLDSEFGTAS